MKEKLLLPSVEFSDKKSLVVVFCKQAGTVSENKHYSSEQNKGLFACF